MHTSHLPMVLIILDGWGYSENTAYNAIHSARKPAWDYLWDNYPHTLLNASGMDVGLPASQMGNSETGHMNIGSGRIVDQEFTRIMKAVENRSFFQKPGIERRLGCGCRERSRSPYHGIVVSGRGT